MAVSREKLKALPAETLAEMAKTDELELIYLHLHSLRNFDRLRDRLAASGGRGVDIELTAPRRGRTDYTRAIRFHASSAAIL